MAQIFKAQRKPAPPDIATKLEKSAAGKITLPERRQTRLG